MDRRAGVAYAEAVDGSLNRGRLLSGIVMARQQWAVGAGVLLGLLVLAVTGRADEAAAVKRVEELGGKVRGEDKRHGKAVLTCVGILARGSDADPTKPEASEDDARRLIKSLQEDPDPRVRASAALLMQGYRSSAPWAVPALENALRDSDLTVVLAAADSLAHIDPGNQTAARVLGRIVLWRPPLPLADYARCLWPVAQDLLEPLATGRVPPAFDA